MILISLSHKCGINSSSINTLQEIKKHANAKHVRQCSDNYLMSEIIIDQKLNVSSIKHVFFLWPNVTPVRLLYVRPPKLKIIPGIDVK